MSTLEDEYLEETEGEREARRDTEVVLDQLSAEFVEWLIDRVMLVVDELSGHPLYSYQRPAARRFVESVIIGDGATLTALWSRQSGKSETVSNTIAALMIILPVLAKIYPDLLGKFREGVWVGAFGPVDDQADTLFARIAARLTSDRAVELMSDPDIADAVKGRGRTISLRSGSLVRKQTAHPRAIIEGRTYHIILIDECQGADATVVNKSIGPMGASTNATMIFTGTPSYEKGVFYRQIQINKREGLKRGARQNHYEADWREAGKANPNYKRFVQKEILRIGEDSDEFKLSYRLMWLLEKGMFTTSEVMERLGDKSMEIVRAWHQSPVVVGIDPARKQDSTIATVVWVDWDHPDEFGNFQHRVLNWLDLNGLAWEEQYHRLCQWLNNYRIFAIAIDSGGVGDVVADRLQRMMPHIRIVPITSSRPEQSKRWKHLSNLMDREMIGWPAHAKTRRLKTWRRFSQQMSDLQKVFTGPHMLAEAPNETDAHDDYADSLALACILSIDHQMPAVQVGENPFYSRSRRN